MSVHTDEFHPRRRQGRGEQPCQVPHRPQYRFSILCQRPEKKAWHQQFRSEEIGFHLHGASLIIPQLFRGIAENHLGFALVKKPVAQLVGNREASSSVLSYPCLRPYDASFPFAHQPG